MRLNIARDDVDALRCRLMRRLEHGVGLANARRITEEDFELPRRGGLFFAFDGSQQLVRVCAFQLHFYTPLCKRLFAHSIAQSCVKSYRCHCKIPSSMRLTFKTLTRGSPKRPRKRPVVHFSMMSRTTASLWPLAFAMRAT